MATSSLSSDNMAEKKNWIRGVNLGGWLIMERYITPYQFAITNCHLRGNLCWYQGQLSAPPSNSTDYKECDLHQCHPAYFDSIFGKGYPLDEWSLARSFHRHRDTGIQWFNYHFDNFLQRQDLELMKNVGVTHLRVPLPHWILGNIDKGEEWISGDRWKYFLRMCQWARELKLEVWPSLHTAPGSQNGFDNSGKEEIIYTCNRWADSSYNVQRTLNILHEITNQFVRDELMDVVTGFGILNEPYFDCHNNIYRDFLDDAYKITRRNLGSDTNIFVSDKFAATTFNDGTWWLNATHYANTYLDTHFYQVFDPKLRGIGPQDHIMELCQPDFPEKDINSCCYEDGPINNTIPSKGVRRISTEWSAAYDCMPGDFLPNVMEGIATHGVASNFYRTISNERKMFLRNYVMAQMISFESKKNSLSDGWFYWTIKMEGGAYGEWDFSRGIREGWIPTPLPEPHISSEEMYGTCMDVYNQTTNTTNNSDVVRVFPGSGEEYWNNYSNVQTNIHKIAKPVNYDYTMNQFIYNIQKIAFNHLTIICSTIILVGVLSQRLLRSRHNQRGRGKWKYTLISDVKT